MDHNSDSFYFTCIILIYYYSAIRIMFKEFIEEYRILESDLDCSIPSIYARSRIRMQNYGYGSPAIFKNHLHVM